MKFIVNIYLKAQKEIPTDEFNLIKHNMLCAINEYWPCEALMATYPNAEKLAKERYEYWFTAHLDEPELHATEVFEVCEKIYPLVMVHVRDQQYINHGDMQIGWTNDGSTAYSASNVYYDYYYRFIFNNKETDYEIVDVKKYLHRICTESPDAMKRYEDKHWMWRSTGSWDNFMEATTLAEAIEEFEAYYENMCWKALESARRSLNTATDNYRLINQHMRYRRNNG